MRTPLALAPLLLACSAPAGTHRVTTVHYYPAAASTALVVASGGADPAAASIPPPAVIRPAAPLVAAGSGAPAVRCPAPQRALAGTPVRLAAEATGEGLRYRWTVSRSPQARYYRFSERFDANDSDAIVGVGAAVPFTSVIVGDYTVVAEVRDAEGRTASCETEVTMAGHGLRVELSWNTSNTDVDLHMVAGREARWVSPADCYYANRRPDASLGEESRQRWLDTDDVDGEGPENIRVDAPDVGEEYRVGVHYYSSHSQPGPTTAIVVIYCGDQRVARFERDLTAERSPNENPFWRVAGVRFRPDGTCDVRRLRGPEVAPQQSLQNALDPV